MAEKMMRLDALVTKEIYESFKKGDIVSNNGFRTKDGAFNSIQPDFALPSDTVTDQLADAAVKGLAIVVTYATSKYGKELVDFAAQKAKWAYGEYVAPRFGRHREAKRAQAGVNADETETKLKLVRDDGTDEGRVRQAV